MSILSKILILIDDRRTISKHDLFEYLPEEKNSILLSGLARLKNRLLIRKINKTKINQYQITDLGKQHIYNDLDWIKIDLKKLKTFIIIFTVPDKFKSSREQFRKSMQGIGMQILSRGALIGKMPSTEFVKNIIEKYKFAKYTKLYEVVFGNANVSEFDQELYQSFDNNAKSFLKYTNRFDKKHLRFRAKTLVFEFSQALKQDSFDHNHQVNLKKYFELYEKIKVFCY